MSEVPIQVVSFDDMVRADIDNFVALTTELGEPLIEFAFMVKDAFDKSRELIQYGLLHSAPSDPATFFQQHPLSKVLKQLQEFREANRKNTAFFNHLSMISESILALNWFMVKPAPTQFIRDMKDAGTFYGNRVLVSNKGNANHTNWVNKWSNILLNVEQYVKQYFLTGFTWGSAAQGGMGKPLGSGGPPPPPPPPAPELFADAFSGSADTARQALINDLNQGTAITSRLKHVSKDTTTKGSQGGQHVKQAINKTSMDAKPEAKIYPPKFVLEGRKWLVEHQKDNPSLKVNNEMSESLAMYKCQTSYLEILKKINNIVIDSCKKVQVLIKGDVISCVEVIRCENIQIQCEGIVPLINVSNSDNIQIFLNEHSQKAELIASKSSSLNMCLVQPDGDYVEHPVPEQIKSVIQNGKLKSTVVENI